TVFSGECRLADLIGVDHEAGERPARPLYTCASPIVAPGLISALDKVNDPAANATAGSSAATHSKRRSIIPPSGGRREENVSLNRPLSGAECAASLPKAPARRSLRYDARLSEPRSPAFPKILMANAPEVTNMALFCDFENVALGVQDAKYERFDIGKVLERLLLKGSIVVKKAYCDWDRYKAFKAPMHEASFELIEIPHVR